MDHFCQRFIYSFDNMVTLSKKPGAMGVNLQPLREGHVIRLWASSCAEDSFEAGLRVSFWDGECKSLHQGGKHQENFHLGQAFSNTLATT